MRCLYCGKEVEDSDAYCPFCGEKVDHERIKKANGINNEVLEPTKVEKLVCEFCGQTVLNLEEYCPHCGERNNKYVPPKKEDYNFYNSQYQMENSQYAKLKRSVVNENPAFSKVVLILSIFAGDIVTLIMAIVVLFTTRRTDSRIRAIVSIILSIIWMLVNYFIVGPYLRRIFNF